MSARNSHLCNVRETSAQEIKRYLGLYEFESDKNFGHGSDNL